MPSPFYRQSNGGGGGAPGSISEAGGKGALALFGEVKVAVTETQTSWVPSRADEAASAKAAADAYATSRTGSGMGAPKDALMQGNGQLDIPQIQLGDNPGTGVGDMHSLDIGKAINDMIAGMGDLINQAIASPMGLLGSFLSFLFKLFTELATSTVQMLNEIAKAAASAIEEAAKKQLEAAQSAAQQAASAGLQPLELFNQAAVTQTLSTALKTTSST